MEFLQGLKDLWFKELPPLPESVERTGVWPFTGNPKEWIDRSDPNYTPSIYTDSPMIDVTGSGIINPVGGAAKGAVRTLRNVMASESRLRGKPLKSVVFPKIEDLIDSPVGKVRYDGEWEAFGTSPKLFQYTPTEGPAKGMTFTTKTQNLDDIAKGALRIARKEESIPEYGLKGLVDETSRGLWLHGRSKYPKTGETFADSRVRVGNLGEPYGISLTADKELLKGSFAKPQGPNISNYTSKYVMWNLAKKQKGHPQTQKLKEELLNMVSDIYETDISQIHLMPTPQQLGKEIIEKVSKISPPFARVFPKFGGAPGEKILPAWVAPETEWAQKIIKDTYIESLPEKLKEELLDDLMLTEVELHEKGTSGSQAIKNYFNDWKYEIDPNIVKEQFNKRISEGLLKKGYKALLYSPERYDEYEMRMLDPNDVMMLDMRKQSDPALSKMYRPTLEDKDLHFYKKGGSQRRKIEKWKEQAASREGASLRNIYEKITWEDIDRVLNKPSNPTEDLDVLIKEADELLKEYP